jgi:hypothetical protein
VHLRSASLIIGLASVVLASPATAASPPTLGAADGVTVTQTGRAVALRLAGPAATAAAAYAGHDLTLSCDTRPGPGLAFASGSRAISSGADAPLRRTADGTYAITATLSARAWDTCEVERPDAAPRRVDRVGPWAVYEGMLRPPLARVALTAAGGRWIDELGRAVALDEAASAALGGRADGLAMLGAQDASPPAGSVGYWTDGHGGVEVVTLSAAGRRLLEESFPDGTQRSNVAGLTTEVAEARSTPAYVLDTSSADRDASSSPLTEDDEEREVPSSVAGARLAVRFTGAARATLRRLGGRRVSVACGPASLPPTPKSARDLFAGFQLTTVRVPRHGGVLHATLRAGRGDDLCLITDDGQRVATTAPTAAGRTALLDLVAVARLQAAAGLAPKTATAYPPAASLAAVHRRTLVALDGPTASPSRAGDKVGVWTDGARQAVLSVVSAAGHRFSMADEGDGMVRENISGVLLVGALTALL